MNKFGELPHRNYEILSTVTVRGNVSKVDIHIMKIAALLAYLYDSSLRAIPSQFVDVGMGIMREMLDYTLSLLVKSVMRAVFYWKFRS